MKISVVNTTGEKKGTIDFDFGKKATDISIASAVLTNLANKRVAIANTKTRAEVSGGGIKPWRQKGTGRARHGSIRSPIWVGGGITFGPNKERNFSKRMNKKQNGLVLSHLLSEKIEEGKVVVLDKIESFSGKTKDVLPFFAKLGVSGHALMVIDDALAGAEVGRNIYLACRNSQLVELANIAKLSAHSIMKYEWLVITKEAMETLKSGLEKMSSKKEVASGKKPAKKASKESEAEEVKEDSVKESE